MCLLHVFSVCILIFLCYIKERLQSLCKKKKKDSISNFAEGVESLGLELPNSLQAVHLKDHHVVFIMLTPPNRN